MEPDSSHKITAFDPISGDLGMAKFSGDVPRGDYEFDASSSQGAGGQNVDKRATKVEIRFHIGKAACLSEWEKVLVRDWVKEKRPSFYLEAVDTILLTDSTSRTQGTNHKNALKKLEVLISTALHPKKERIPTTKPKLADENRLKEKKHRSEIKASRRDDSDSE